MRKMNNTMKEISQVIKGSEQILIASHVNPDGDNLGSSLGLYLALKKIGKKVYILQVDKIPKDYLFLPKINEIIKYDKLKIEDNYTFIALDSADIGRLGINQDIAKKATNLINIDHHISNPKYGNYNYVDSDSSATGELVFELIKEMDIDLDKDIATCLYTAISSDTGSFMYSNTTSKTHRIVAELYKEDLDTNEININLYQNNSFERTMLYSNILMDTELYFDGKLAMSMVTRELLDKTGALMEESEGLVENMRDIEGVEVSILIKEYDGYIRVSTRSKRYVDVSEICSEFNGGGHERAAGCTIELNKPLDQIKAELVEEVGRRI